MLIPAPRVEVFPCAEKGCDGFYEPYSDGRMVCYDGHVSSLSVDDVELPVGVLVPILEEC